jgi:hypothetical protein
MRLSLHPSLFLQVFYKLVVLSSFCAPLKQNIVNGISHFSMDTTCIPPWLSLNHIIDVCRDVHQRCMYHVTTLIFGTIPIPMILLLNEMDPGLIGLVQSQHESDESAGAIRTNWSEGSGVSSERGWLQSLPRLDHLGPDQRLQNMPVLQETQSECHTN